MCSDNIHLTQTIKNVIKTDWHNDIFHADCSDCVPEQDVGHADCSYYYITGQYVVHADSSDYIIGQHLFMLIILHYIPGQHVVHADCSDYIPWQHVVSG